MTLLLMLDHVPVPVDGRIVVTLDAPLPCPGDPECPVECDGGRTASGLPGCPECHGPLFEVETIGVWNAQVNQHALTTGDLDYPNFVEWLRGKCLPSVEVAREWYRHEFPARIIVPLADGPDC